MNIQSGVLSVSYINTNVDNGERSDHHSFNTTISSQCTQGLTTWKITLQIQQYNFGIIEGLDGFVEPTLTLAFSQIFR